MGSRITMNIPPAIKEMVQRYFGENAYPDYSKTLRIMQRDPYGDVKEEFSKFSEIIDITDYNSDLGSVLILKDIGDQPIVRLSYVGPFAVVTDSTGSIMRNRTIDDILTASGFSLIQKEILELPVRIWEPEVEGRLYEFLFEFDEGLPWAR
jgi:hypothetical protein